MSWLKKNLLAFVALVLVWTSGTVVASATVSVAVNSHALASFTVTRQVEELNTRIASLRSSIATGSLTQVLDAVIERTASEIPISTAIVGKAIGGPSVVREALADLERAVILANSLVRASAGGGGASPVAASLIAAAIDRTLPALRLDPSSLARSGTVAGCDLVDEPPIICVGSVADNVYTDDVALLVDLGGNDQYSNSAGGAPFNALDQTIRVSVNLDLGGDDVYSGFVEDSPCWGSVGQGGACLESVGMLVDAAGNDRYIAELPRSTRAYPANSLQGGGYGDGAIGALFDLGGNDRYSVKALDGEEQQKLVAQGAGDALGTGVLLDAGSGDDTYEVDMATLVVAGQAPTGQDRWISAQGAGTTLAAGMLSDGGGRDSFSVTAGVRNERTAEDASNERFSPLIIAYAQGASTFGGFGLVLAGEGDTSYGIDIRAEGRAASWLTGQGASEKQSDAAIDDRDGDDSYRVDVEQSLTREVSVDDHCVKSGQRCTRAETTLVAPGPSKTYVQGSGSLESAGQLLDHGGNDSYSTVADHEVSVDLHDHLSAPTAVPRLAAEGYRSLEVQAQAAGSSASGILVDDSGTDEYLLDVDNTVSARADSDHASGTPIVTARIFGLSVDGQGATGVGTLFLDRGGAGDEVVSTTDVVAETKPAGGAFVQTMTWPVVQGGGADARFLVLGEDPSIHSSPSRPACPASVGVHRGYGTWTDCPMPPVGAEDGQSDPGAYDTGFPGRASMGHVPNAPPAALPTLTMTPDTPGSAPRDSNDDPTPNAVHIPVGARLLDATGAPLAGEEVHFTLQIWLDDYWQIHQQVDATTDENGIARAMLPALRTYLPPPGPWRIAATYDGAPGVFYPRHVASPLTLIP